MHRFHGGRARRRIADHGAREVPFARLSGIDTCRKPGLGVSGATSYLYYTTDSLDVVYAWYKGKVPGGQERIKVPGKIVSYAVPGSAYVNVMLVISKKGGTDVSLSP